MTNLVEAILLKIFTNAIALSKNQRLNNVSVIDMHYSRVLIYVLLISTPSIIYLRGLYYLCFVFIYLFLSVFYLHVWITLRCLLKLEVTDLVYIEN